LKKQTVLEILIEHYPDITKDALYARVLCGEVFVDGERARDPKQRVNAEAAIGFEKKEFVSRGGTKLQYALEQTGLHIKGKTIIDAGSSTGGFTDCLLQNGASHVHAVDVGTNQIAYQLRIDSRVTVHENTNILDLEDISPVPDLATADISFRSIRGVATHLISLTKERTALVLVKPQFEQEKDKPGFRGVLSDPADIRATLSRVIQNLWIEEAFPEMVVRSPITGRKGNVEFFMLLSAAKTQSIPELQLIIDRMI
jgi:23S rRNA (cytidine1920-2'-O)/16S rRNA (cytidine1409-2'-O)-methyltransferase